jgi:hypothetical protein
MADARRIQVMREQLAKDAELSAAWEVARRAQPRLPIRPDREELAWAAGFFDGEGTTCISVNRKAGTSRGPSLQIHVSLPQVGPWCLFRFRQAVGGLGAIYPVPPRNGHQPQHRWQIGSFEGAQAVIAMLWPFLTSVKRKQAADCLQLMHEYHQTLNATNYWVDVEVTVPGGTSHTATASLTVTPSFSAGRTRGRYRAGALAVTPSFHAVGRGGAQPAAVPQGSWWGLDSVFKQSRQEFEAYVSRPPTACPVCGEPLVNGPATAAGSGVELYCKFAGGHHFRYPGDWTPPSRPVPW